MCLAQPLKGVWCVCVESSSNETTRENVKTSILKRMRSVMFPNIWTAVLYYEVRHDTCLCKVLLLKCRLFYNTLYFRDLSTCFCFSPFCHHVFFFLKDMFIFAGIFHHVIVCLLILRKRVDVFVLYRTTWQAEMMCTDGVCQILRHQDGKITCV